MGNITTEQKLWLVRQIRAENQDNRMKMRNRERLLYGAEYPVRDYSREGLLPLYSREYRGEDSNLMAAKELSVVETGYTQNNNRSGHGFKVRLILAVILSVAFLAVDSGSGTIGGISTQTLLETMNRDFDAGLEEVVFDFEDNFPYTLFKK